MRFCAAPALRLMGGYFVTCANDEWYGLEPALANTVLGAGISVSLLTVPLANPWLGT